MRLEVFARMGPIKAGMRILFSACSGEQPEMVCRVG